MQKLFSKGDLIVVRTYHQNGNHFYITPTEMREVMAKTNEPAFCLYSYYRTSFLHEAAQVDDDAIGETIGWPATKVKKYRLVLEKANLLRRIKQSAKQFAVTRVIVGAEYVALFDAGLPDTILNYKAFQKLKKTFKIESTEDLIANVELIASEFNRNPDLYR